MELDRIIQHLALTDPAEIAQATACWEWALDCALAQAQGRSSPDMPPLRLPDRARSGVIWAHSCSAGAEHGLALARYPAAENADAHGGERCRITCTPT